MDSQGEAATAIVRRLRQEGFSAYLVGGCVRDMLMGRTPKDYDVTTAATPDEVLRLFPDALTVGAQFGVVIVPHEAGNVEVATFRSDGAYADGRHPREVRYAQTPQEDVQRRDFTINGLLYDPLTDQVLDYVGGQADIRARRLRTIGDPVERLSEDRLRMLRAVRFTARFGFKLDPAALEAIRQLAPQIPPSAPSACAMRSSRFSPRGRRGRASSFWTNPDYSPKYYLRSNVFKGCNNRPSITRRATCGFTR